VRRAVKNWGKLLSRLRTFYRYGDFRVPVLRERGADPFRVLVSTVVSHRTQDSVTARITRELLRTYPTPKAMSQAKEADLIRVVARGGLASAKGRGLLEASRMIVNRFGGQVPVSERELLELPMVGPKTASAVAVFAYGRSSIPVDVHIHRVANRIGAVHTNSPEQTALALMRVVPKRYWSEINPILVQHGQNVCTARRPQCRLCPIGGQCSRVGLPAAQQSFR
jgi:endonuclease III